MSIVHGVFSQPTTLLEVMEGGGAGGAVDGVDLVGRELATKRVSRVPRPSMQLETRCLSSLFDRFKTISEKPELRDYLVRFFMEKPLSCQVDLETSVRELPDVIVPKVELMKKICDHYKEKYNIRIQICKISELRSMLGDLRGDPLNKGPVIEGLIVTDDSGEGHVVPLLFEVKTYHMETDDCDQYNRIFQDCLNLDVLGDRRDNMRLNLEIKSCLGASRRGRRYLTSAVMRQADGWSCRTDALVVLRNALIYCNHHKITELKDLIIDHSPETSEVSILPDLYFHSQIMHENGLGDKRVTRAAYSNDEAKRASPELLARFRERFKGRVTLIKKYTFMTNLISIGEILHSFREKTTEVQGSAVLTIHPKYDHEIRGWEFTIEESEEKFINTYQVAKGYKIAKKFGSHFEPPEILSGE